MAFDLSMASALQQALLLDSEAILQAARLKYGATFSTQSRLVVLVDNLGKQCTPLLQKLVNERNAFGRIRSRKRRTARASRDDNQVRNRE